MICARSLCVLFSYWSLKCANFIVYVSFLAILVIKFCLALDEITLSFYSSFVGAWWNRKISCFNWHGLPVSHPYLQFCVCTSSANEDKCPNIIGRVFVLTIFSFFWDRYC